MASLICSGPVLKAHFIIKSQFNNLGLSKDLRPPQRVASVNRRLKTLPILCSKLFPWETESAINDNENSIIKRGGIIEPVDCEDSSELATVHHEQDTFEVKREPSFNQPLKWPMWLLGPSVLLATGMVPTLWLPLSSVFVGPNIAGLLSLVGLDCIFNMGATLFLLMADSCARPKHGTSSSTHKDQVPLTYKLWNLGASFIGSLVPLLMLFASRKGYFQPHLPLISFLVLLGPYLLLLSAQVLTEMLTWHWRSPVWLLVPIVYEGYRILQLMRGLRLGIEIGAAGWVVDGVRVLVSWWVLVLGIQLMRVAWFAGLELRVKDLHQVV